MKITTILIFAVLMQVSAAGLAQKVTFSKKNASLEQIFNEVRTQTGYNLLWPGSKLDIKKQINVNFKNASLDDVMEKTLEALPMTFTIEEQTILIKEKEPSFIDNIIARFQAIDVYGRVVDQNGSALVGATVRVKNGKGSAITGNDGRFSIKGVENDAILVVTYLGYMNKEIAAGADLTGIVLVISDNKLDQVEIQAYSTTSKRLSTSNIGTVKAEDIAKQPVQNPLLALQGRVPGVVIEQQTGLPGAAVKVRIQGQNSLKRGNVPLYVIDGIPYTQTLLPALSPILRQSGDNDGTNSAPGGNPLSFINPSDIESIDVLKDADATSIYGSRAAAGAILITTKKGKAGDTKIDVNILSGVGNVASKLKLLNTQQYLEMRKEAYQNDGLSIPTSSTSPSTSNYDLTLWDQNRNTDWQEELIGGTARYTDVNLTLSGGNTYTQFLVGGTFHKETTVFPGTTNDQKGAMHFNLNNTSANQKFRFQLDGKYMLDNNRLPGTDLTSAAINMSPNAPALYNADGTLNFHPLANGNSTFRNPLISLVPSYRNQTKNLLANTLIGYQILKGLNIKSTFSYSNMQVDEVRTSPSTASLPEQRVSLSGGASFGSGSISSLNIEPQINFNTHLGIGIIDVLVGSTFLESRNGRQSFDASGFTSDALLEDISSASSIAVSSTLNSTYRYNALFGRITYNLYDRYIFNISARRDGSSRYGSANVFSNFGSLAGAWLFSNENFVKKHFSFVSFGKIKASYGTTGNDQIGNYQFMSLYQSDNLGIETPYQNITGLTVQNLPNSYLEWERTRKLNIGLDLGFFSDRILINGNYYYNKSSNQLTGYSLPIIAGFDFITKNLPATIQNSGLELSLNTVNISGKNLIWSSSFNITMPRNKLVSYPGIESSTDNSFLIIGQPITVVKVYKYLGVDPQTGTYQVADENGKPILFPNFLEDRIALINPDPKYYGGFQNSLSYKGLSLDFLFQFTKQTGINYLTGNRPGMFANNGLNQPITVLDRWQKPGDVKPIQKYSTNTSIRNNYDNALRSEFNYSDASYIRLKNISISCQLPQSFKEKLHLQNARFFVQGQNLLTITNYKGLDPENRSTLTLPPLRMLVMGINLTL